MPRYVCVHGHFYQPPRENPWLDEVESQDSAAPFHDWNERITVECYAPNAAARILDAEGYLEQVVNNYSRISFNFGATLLSWLERHAPATYEAILDADRGSRSRFGGHGGAIAQAYSHVILPLANARDKRTQVLWGVADFERRFGRKPEGMWLPETAVDLDTLEALADAGIDYTILAPHQARRVKLEGEGWTDVTEATLDTTRPYRVILPSRRSICVFFYNGAVSHAVAFERLIDDGGRFAERLIESTGAEDGSPRLGHIATDGETYGHHSRFGEMGLAFALRRVERDDAVRLTNYGEYLSLHPPAALAEIAEETSWSCAHGVERWRSDCGCNIGSHPGWNQQWRAPLRDAIDWLRDFLARRFEVDGRTLLRDPWLARDAYVSLVLDRSPENVEKFLAAQASHELDADERRRALTLLEIQRQAMLMYASCAWFFDDISGIETVQALLHAGRAIQLLDRISAGADETEDAFIERLAAAKSNLREEGSGADIYRRYVLPAKVNLEMLARHYAVSTVFQPHDEIEVVGSYRMLRRDSLRVDAGQARFTAGMGRVESLINGAAGDFYYALLHLGDQNLVGGLVMSDDYAAYERVVGELKNDFTHGDFAALTRHLTDAFPGEPLSFASLFRDSQRRAIRTLLAPVLAEAEGAYRAILDEHPLLINYLSRLGQPLPERLSIAVKLALDAELAAGLEADEIDIERLQVLLKEAARMGAELDEARLTLAFGQALERLIDAFSARAGRDGSLGRLEAAIALLKDLSFEVNLSRAQTAFLRAVQSLPDTRQLAGRLAALAQALRVRVSV